MLDSNPRSRTNILNYEFVKFQRPLFRCFFVLLVFVLCLYTVVTIIGSEDYVRPLEVALTVVPLILAIGCATRCMHFRFTEFFVMIICLIIYCLYFQIKFKEVISNADLGFGYLVAFFERMILERLPMFGHKALFSAFTVVVRSIIIGMDDIYDSLLRASLFLFGLILDYNKEKKERELFKSFYDCKETINGSKELFKSYISDSIIIISSDLRKNLYTNNALHTAFPFAVTNPKDFLQSFSLQKDELSRAKTGLVRLKSSVKPKSEKEKEKEREKEEEEEDVKKQEESRISESELNLESISTLTLFSHLEMAIKTEGAFENRFEHTFIYSVPNQKALSKIVRIKVLPSFWEGQACFYIIINDLTDQIALKNLKKEENKKEKVITTISHELRTPLNGILGMVQIMEKEIVQPRFIRYLKTCKNSAKLLLGLVNSILDLSQLKNNKLKLIPGSHRIKDILDDITSLFDFQCQAKQLYLRVEIAKSLPKSIFTDRNRLTQIMINLIGNALKFTFEGGIIISVEKDIIDPSNIRFSVSDTGIGIEDKDKDKLLKMYGKIEGTAHINPQGVGLGLNISNTLAHLLNENDEDSGIKIESEYKKGSTFSFLIKEHLYGSDNMSLRELDNNSKTIYRKPKKVKPQNDSRKLRIDTTRTKILEYESNERYRMTNEVTEANMESYDKINKNLTALNTSQVSLETPRQTQTLISQTKEVFSTMGNLDQTYTSPRTHLLGRPANPLSPGKDQFLAIDSAPQILIIDDNPFNLMVARELIETQGIYTHTALNGEIGIDQVVKRNQEKQPYKLILMDCEMPVMNGFEATKKLIKKMNKGEITKVPIIAVTANSIATVKDKCLKSGMVDCLSKPLLEEDLKALIAKYVTDNPADT